MRVALVLLVALFALSEAKLIAAPRMQLAKLPKMKADDYCLVCDAVLPDVQKIMESPTAVADITMALEFACSKLVTDPAKQQDCINAVNGTIGVLSGLVNDGVNLTQVVCNDIMKCSTAVMAGDPCADCTQATSLIYEIFSNSTNVLSIEGALDSVCDSIFSDPTKDQLCRNIIDDSLNIIEGIVDATDNFNFEKIICYDILKVCAQPPTQPPTHAPGPDHFSQKQCQDQNCTQQCQSMEFPTNSCLSLSGGGSALAWCANFTLFQQVFAVDGCVGESQTTSMPTKTCLQQDGGGSFENYCPAGN